MKKHLSHSLLQNIKTEDLLVKKAFFFSVLWRFLYKQRQFVQILKHLYAMLINMLSSSSKPMQRNHFSWYTIVKDMLESSVWLIKTIYYSLFKKSNRYTLICVKVTN